jgi:hypothetical protein
MRPYKAAPNPSFLLFSLSSSLQPPSRPPAARRNSPRLLYPTQIPAPRSFLSLPTSLPTRSDRASDIPWPESTRPHAAAHWRRPRSTSPLTTTFRPVSNQIRYGKCISTLPRCSCAPLPSRERECTATSRRRPCSTPCLGAHHPPLGTVGPVGRVGPVLPRPSPRRRREPAGQTHQPSSRADKGPSVNSFPILGSPVQETEGLFASLLFSVSCQLVKSLGMCRKI